MESTTATVSTTTTIAELATTTTGGEQMEITSALLEPVTTAINSGLTTLVPVGIGIMATFIGISLVKRVIYTFL